MNIKDQLKKLPEKPGVYLMKDKNNHIIYVGKSKNLKNRVSSYFRGFNSHGTKVQTMVVNIAEFEYIITDTEMEALILEANLIKKHQPRFNILLRDDKTYPYIKVTLNEKYPRVIKTRRLLKDKAKYFGPYTDVDAVNRTIDTINRVYPIRKCNKNLEKNTERPCLNFHIGKCLGPCQGEVHHEEYMEIIDEILQILSGKYEMLIPKIESKMHSAAETLNFEKAAMYRNQLEAIQRLQVKQRVVTTSDVNQDIISWAREMGQTCIMLFFVRNGKLLGNEKFILDDTETESIDDILSSFLVQHYSGTPFIPKEVILSDPPSDHQLIEDWLTHKADHKVKVIVPQRGEKKKVADLVRKNAQEYIDKFKEQIEVDKYKRQLIRTGLEDILQTGKPIRRIEAYDISNIYGVLSVGSMVVFEDGKKKRSDYRRFKVKTIEGANDYGSMMEILFRRFRRGLEEQEELKRTGVDNGRFSVFPDLLLIDGGKGHVNSVLDVLNALGLDIPVAGMVKDDKHRTDRLYYAGEMVEIKSNHEIYRYVASIQEEVHRFAIEYHRALRNKQMTYSVLDDIPGIGKTRRTSLMKHFKSIDSIRQATVDELAEVDGINRKVAEAIFDYFNTKYVQDEAY